MKTKLSLKLLGTALALSTINYQVSIHAQATDITYQGRLNDGTNPATGTYDLRFALFADPDNPGTLIAGPVTNTATGVTNGLLTVILKFPAGSFPAADTWLEVAVRTNGGNSFVTLAPRQKVTPTPYALWALNAASANLANNVQSTTVLQGQALQVGVNNFISTSSASIAGGMNNLAEGAYISIGGGYQNTATGGDSIFIGGGSANYASGDRAVVAGGENNSANGDHAFIGGGGWNSAGAYDVVSGGSHNTVSADKSGIGSGDGNTVSGYASWIGGGQTNLAAGNYSVVGGGRENSASDYSAVIAGGANNFVSGGLNGIGSGYNNQVTGSLSWIGGGQENSATTNQSVVGGGYQNDSSAIYSSVGGGWFNNIEPLSDGGVIGGGVFNRIREGSPKGSISGGQQNEIGTNSLYCSIGGGAFNSIGDNSYAAVVSGSDNRIQLHSFASTIAGGDWNQIGTNSTESTISGGGFNQIGVSSTYSTVGGGRENTASNSGATVPGGVHNTATGRNSFAAGYYAMAVHPGSFVWSDDRTSPFSSTTDNQFSVRAKGGVRLNTDTSLYFGSTSQSVLTNDQGGSIELGDSTHNIDMPYIDFHYGLGTYQDFNVRMVNDGMDQLTIKRSGSATPMAQFSPGGLEVNGALVSTSDRNQKENFQPVDASDVLTKVAALPLSKWNYKEDKRSTHLGPMAQDFYAAFGVGPDDKHIATVDADGVALAAIQGLNQKLEEQLKQQLATNAELKQQLAEIKESLRQLSTEKGNQP